MRARTVTWWSQLVVTGAVVALASVAADGRIGGASRIGEAVAFPVPTAAASCPSWGIHTGDGRVDDGGMWLWTDALAYLVPCPHEAASFRLRGSLSGGRGPWAVVTGPGGSLLYAGEVPVDGHDLVSAVPVLVSFSNDLVRRGEDRNLRVDLR